MKLYEIKKDLVEMLDLLTEVGDDELAKENCEEMLEFLKEELKSKSGSFESEKVIFREEIERL